jgi:hypothetical protein
MTEEEDDIDMRREPGSVYVRAMVELIEPEEPNIWRPPSDAAKWPIPFSVHELDNYYG